MYCRYQNTIYSGEFMAEKQLKIKDMIIAVICTLLAVLGIVFYFLPAFSVEHSASLSFEISEKLNYSAWDITQAAFTSTKDWGSHLIGLICIKDVYGMAVMISGILMPIGLVFIVATAVFAYLSWFKGESFKKFCFLCSLCGMVFVTITLISTWFIAIQLRSNTDVLIDYFSYNIKSSISYGAFVSLIIAFVVAIVACAYNYFLDNFDEEDWEDDDDEDEDDDEEEEEPRRRVVKQDAVINSSAPAKSTTTNKTTTSKTSTTRNSATAHKSTTTKSSTSTNKKSTSNK